MDKSALEAQIAKFGEWYHKIDLGDGVVTPGIRNQGLVFSLYEKRLPSDLTGARVLDLGANAGGLSVEFARRGADVVAIEHHIRYVEQARWVAQQIGLDDKIKVHHGDLFSAIDKGAFDIVCYVGLSYHIRYTQLALDMLSWLCTGHLLTSTQTQEGDGLVLWNRASTAEKRAPGELWGWEPTEELYVEMIMHAGFKNAELVSTRPHAGETPANRLSNRSYFYAQADKRVPLPFLSEDLNSKPRHSYLAMKRKVT